MKKIIINTYFLQFSFLRLKLKYLKINPKTPNWLKKVVQVTKGAIITRIFLEKSLLFNVDLFLRLFMRKCPFILFSQDYLKVKIIEVLTTKTKGGGANFYIFCDFLPRSGKILKILLFDYPGLLNYIAIL